MRITTFSNYFPEHAGGIEFVALNLTQRWRMHHPVLWVACDDQKRPHSPGAEDLALHAWNFTEQRLGFPYPLPLGKSVFQIFQAVRQSEIVHLHDCLYAANFLAFLAARWYRNPVVVTQHVGPVPYVEKYKNLLQAWAYRGLGRLILGNAEQVVFINERVRRGFEEQMRLRRPGLLIPNGVDHALFRPPVPAERDELRERLGFAHGECILLFTGRFTQKKGLHLIRQLAQARPGLRWVLIGGGEIDPQTWQLPNLNVLPPQDQLVLREYFAASDLLILPSVGEGFPLVVQEALSCGLPAAVSSETHAQLPDAPLIALNPTDLDGSLTTLDTICSSPEQLSRLRSSALSYAERWDWDQVANQYEDLFSRLLAFD